MFSELQSELYVSSLKLKPVKYLSGYEIQPENSPYQATFYLTIALDHLYSAIANDQNQIAVRGELAKFASAIKMASDAVKLIRDSRSKNPDYLEQIIDDVVLLAVKGVQLDYLIKKIGTDTVVEKARNANLPTTITLLNNRYKALIYPGYRETLSRKTVKALNDQNRPRH